MMHLTYRDLSIRGLTHSIEFANKQNHINGIENFWSQAKRDMRKFNGISRNNFVLYLKACEWRFNHSSFKYQQKQLRQWVRMYLN